jgi:beta-glucosidase
MTALPTTSHLPADFVWGVATSAAQIEGGVHQDGRSASIWDVFANTPGRVKHGDDPDIACDHRNRWEEDLDLLVTLGVPAYRLSLSWSRLQPEGRGPLNPAAVTWYRELLAGLQTRGIRPFVTLYHWDMPQTLEEEGGWTNRRTAELFGEYTGLVAEALGDLAGDWITINEPLCAALLGYAYGVHAPGRTDLPAAIAASHHLNLAHGLATAAVRARRPRARIGVSNIVADLVPGDGPRDVEAAARVDAINHQLFLAPIFTGAYTPAVHAVLDPHGLSDVIKEGDLELISVPLDFVGVNHYQRVVVTDDPAAPLTGAREHAVGEKLTSFGWSITPDALTTVLEMVAGYTDLPLYVTENGASFADVLRPDGRVEDAERVGYLQGYIGALDDAAAAGSRIAGYFAWSLMDNFEWAEGYEKRFGLIYVEFSSQRRVPKSSAHYYSGVIAAHAAASSGGAV